MSDESAAAAASPIPAATPVPGEPPAAPTPAAATSGAAQVMTLSRLTKIRIQNYRAYRGNFGIDLPKGENLLVYGENGAGKSSLYHTLRVFFEAPDYVSYDTTTRKHRPLAITDHRHRFTTDAPAIQLDFGARSFQWSETTNDTMQDSVRLVNQGKGFLDYKALLGIHYVPLDQGISIDLFPLIIGRLLPYYTFPSGGRSLSFQQGWKELHSSLSKPWFGTREQDFTEALATFNAALERTTHDLGARASTMLATFGNEFAAEFHLENAQFKARPKRILGPRILVRPAFRKQQLHDYYSFFNEGRLSALAICLFFAALKESPATGLRILALDDILIGLDMGNRLKVLELVNEHFASWQIFVFTYSKAWFEILKDRVKALNWPAPWASVVLWEEWHDEENSPRVVAEGSGDLLEMAQRHLQRKDFTGAAVYARKALESLCHRTCAKATLPVLHVELPKHRKVEHFLVALKRRLDELVDETRRGKALELFAQLEQGRSFVLNRNAHFDVEEEDTLSGEVGVAIEVVKQLTEFLNQQAWEKANFHSGRTSGPFEQMNAYLAAARALAAKGAQRQCRDAMEKAHDFFWYAYGKKLGVLVPIGAELTRSSIRKALEEQAKLPEDAEARLASVRKYLFGSVKGDEFDATKFEDAAKVLEELAA